MANNLSKRTYRYLVNNFEIFTRFQVWRTRNQYTYKVLNDNSVAGNPTIHFIHRYITNNTGDKVCGYYLYFLEEFKDYRCIVHDINFVELSLIKSEDVVIIGGGGLLNATAEWNYNINKAAGLAGKAIIWSAGFNAKKGSNSSNALNWDAFDLVTVRDFSYENFRYTPCATCVMPALEKTYVNKRKIGVVGHKDVMNHLPEEMKGYELITNSVPIEEFVEFIGTSEIVFTNSYHAAYWSTLMQKKCILFAPRSEKYDYYKYPPSLFTGDLSKDISQAKIYPNALDESIDLTRQYLKDIISIIKS